MNTDLSRYAKLIGLYHGKWYDVQLIIWNKRGIYAALLNGCNSPIRVKNPIFKEGMEQVELPNLPRIEVEDGFRFQHVPPTDGKASVWYVNYERGKV